MPVEQAIAWARGYAANPGKERRREVRALLVEIHAVRGQLADSADAVNELRAENERLRVENRRLREDAWARKVGPAWLHESNEMCEGTERELTKLRAELADLRRQAADELSREGREMGLDEAAPGPRCSKRGTRSCLEDRNSGWYDDEVQISPWNEPPRPDAARRPGGDEATPGELMDLLDTAWGVIANAGCGATHDGTVGWHNETEDWQRAAERLRDRWHEVLRVWCSNRSEPPRPDPARHPVGDGLTGARLVPIDEAKDEAAWVCVPASTSAPGEATLDPVQGTAGDYRRVEDLDV